jgi:hypothetical protein
MKNICRFCKNWGGKYFSVADMLKPSWQGFGWTDPVAAREYIIESRNTEKGKWSCPVLKDTLEIDLDQGSGYDAGDASVEEVNTPGDFGCNKWEPWETT